MRKKFIYYSLLLVIASIGLACSDDGPVGPTGSTTLRLTVSNLVPLINGFHYEGWAIIGGSAVSTGKFNVSGEGILVNLEGSNIPNGDFDTGVDLTDATTIIITIEPNGDTDAVPATTHILAGDVSGASASLTVAHSSALGNDFTGSAGSYILATPTDGADTNENSGIWFLDPSGSSVVAGLQLPTLPTGWKYEGCVVIDGTPVTTGTFTAVDQVDEADPYSSTQDGPPFPGEDFLLNAPTGLTFPTDIAGMTAVILIEPFPDDAVTPFLHLLVRTIPLNAIDHVLYNLDNAANTFPTMTATIRE